MREQRAPQCVDKSLAHRQEAPQYVDSKRLSNEKPHRTPTANASVPQHVVRFPQGAPQYVDVSLVHRRGTLQCENDKCHSALGETNSHKLTEWQGVGWIY